jgi:hypothetical protein
MLERLAGTGDDVTPGPFAGRGDRDGRGYGEERKGGQDE